VGFVVTRTRTRWWATTAAVAFVLTALTSAPAGAALPPPGPAASGATGATQPPTGPPVTDPPVTDPPVTPPAASTKPYMGGWSIDYAWYDANVGKATIYRTYDAGFQYTTFQQTLAYQQHGMVTEDYSFQIPPTQLSGTTTWDARVKTFVASLPKNSFVTNWHEPENDIEAGTFTAAQWRAALVKLAQLVRQVNAADGGHRKVSVILMYDTVYGYKGRDPMNYWPGKDPNGRNWADVISFDTYALPHNTMTACCPRGFTDGVKWQQPKYLLDPSIAFARKIGSPWMISEFGYLEDVNNPTRKAKAITDFVAYARANGALSIEYWDNYGSRADWQLRYSAAATKAWRDALAAP
jgi:hypothetical protein